MRVQIIFRDGMKERTFEKATAYADGGFLKIVPADVKQPLTFIPESAILMATVSADTCT